MNTRKVRNGLWLCRCGEEFSTEVWHCPICIHHWPMSRVECWNCHRYKRRIRRKTK